MITFISPTVSGMGGYSNTTYFLFIQYIALFKAHCPNPALNIKWFIPLWAFFRFSYLLLLCFLSTSQPLFYSHNNPLRCCCYAHFTARELSEREAKMLISFGCPNQDTYKFLRELSTFIAQWCVPSAVPIDFSYSCEQSALLQIWPPVSHTEKTKHEEHN